MKKCILSFVFIFLIAILNAQQLVPFKLPETGQTGSFTITPGEDADFVINPISLTNNGNGTTTDNNTGLMWQKTDGGEMTFENAIQYCNTLSISGFTDWRLPTGLELFSINNYNSLNPALDTAFFTKTLAEYWWTSEKRADDTTKIWVVNAGGGIGAHPKTETLSAGGVKHFHVRAVRTPITTPLAQNHFTNNGNGTITDNRTGLCWQKIQSTTTMTWEEALVYSKTVSLGGKTDWRIPNIKELQSLNDPAKFNPSVDNNFFTNITTGNYWSSTTMQNTAAKAWDINLMYGIVSYNDKTLKERVILVRGGLDNASMNISEVLIPGGEFDMGDHFGFVDPGHPSDETPIHIVSVDSFYMANTETTNDQFLTYLNAAKLSGKIHVQNNIVRNISDTNIICYTYQYAPYYSISYNGNTFSMADFRVNHPMVGVMWFGAVGFCNWLSGQNTLQPCYDTLSWDCNFTKNGYRLPTEAEWEYAARGGHLNPYFNYVNGDTIKINMCNLPASGDPYETVSWPQTTPVGFYDGTLRLKSAYNWPGTATIYQTLDGANGFGLYDMQGNVWELINDWYGQNYYSLSPYDNPTGPTSGFIMPDGKPYRGMRGGNWYNGLTTNGVNDGHSRVSNRNPSYYRGPQDPNHPWYHIGFRISRKYSITTGIEGNTGDNNSLFQAFPNPFSGNTRIEFELKNPGFVSLEVYNCTGQKVAGLLNGNMSNGVHSCQWDANHLPAGIYTCKLQIESKVSTRKMIVIK